MIHLSTISEFRPNATRKTSSGGEDLCMYYRVFWSYTSLMSTLTKKNHNIAQKIDD